MNAGNKKHTQHAPSTKTECDYLNGWIKKRSHTQKSHPKLVNPRDIAGERKKKKKKKNSSQSYDSTGEQLLDLPLLCIYADLSFVGGLTSQQHASVSQGPICSDNFMCCHTEREVADQTFHLTPSQYTDTGPTSPSADPIMPGAWQGSHRSANF